MESPELHLQSLQSHSIEPDSLKILIPLSLPGHLKALAHRMIETPLESKEAAKMGNTAFFEPLILTDPDRGFLR